MDVPVAVADVSVAVGVLEVVRLVCVRLLATLLSWLLMLVDAPDRHAVRGARTR